MAEKEFKKAGRPLTLCLGRDCVGARDSHGALLPSMRFHTRPGFNYTTPTHHPPHSAQDRKDHGCIYDKKKKKFTGSICVKKNKKSECAEEAPDTYCKPSSKPCDSDRVQCPVQLIFIEGKPHLRFCRKKGEPGFIVRAGTPAAARRKAQEACASWDKYQFTFFDKKAPQIPKEARKTYPKSRWGRPGLGDAGTRPASALPPLVFQVGGILLGLLLASPRKKSLPAVTPPKNG